MSPESTVKCPDCNTKLVHRTMFGLFRNPKEQYKDNRHLTMRHKKGDIWDCKCCNCYFHTFDGDSKKVHGGYIDEPGYTSFEDLV